jgi:hypothetical protein
MKAREPAAQIVERFLDEFTLEDAYHRKPAPDGPVRRLVFVQYVEPEGGGVHVEFTVDSDDLDLPDDPDVQALVARAIEALRRAHPELAGTLIRVTVD